MRKAYLDDLKDDEWTIVEPLLPISHFVKILVIRFSQMGLWRLYCWKKLLFLLGDKEGLFKQNLYCLIKGYRTNGTIKVLKAFF